MTILCFDSKKMMLTDEKGKPYVLKSTIVAMNFYGSYINTAQFSLLLDLSSSSKEVSFDLYTQYAGKLYVQGANNSTERYICDLSAGQNKVSCSLTTKPSFFIEFTPSNELNGEVLITNIILPES